MTTALDAFCQVLDLELNEGQTSFYYNVVNGKFTKLLLTGEAGTGKTFVLTQALAQAFRDKKRVVLCAPTHLARVNLVNKLPEDVRPYVETKTVASLLSRVGFSIGDGTTGFSSPKGDKLGGYDIIAIDEVSMLSENDYNVLMDSATKIIFTGDFAQLPTVMQRRADMLNDAALEHVHLTEQMRQQGVIHQVAERNREEVYFPTESMADNSSSVTVHRTTHDMLEQMTRDIIADERGIDGHVEYRYITHTNAKVSEVGGFIRDMVIAHDLGIEQSKQAFATGEYLLSYQTTAASYNGEVVKVVDVNTSPMQLSAPWSAYQICIEGSRGVCWVNAIAPNDRHLAEAKINELQELLKEAQRHKAFDAAASYLEQIEHINNFYVKLMYPFAVTCHKSQGMTIENVYVDTQSFSKANNKRALLYVGLSRASKALHTVVVEPPKWKLIRDINDRYRLLKAQWEEAFAEPHWKARVKSGLPASTAEQKEVLCEWMECVLLDWEQEQADKADEDVL
jgi:hypothetical protein